MMNDRKLAFYFFYNYACVFNGALKQKCGPLESMNVNLKIRNTRYNTIVFDDKTNVNFKYKKEDFVIMVWLSPGVYDGLHFDPILDKFKHHVEHNFIIWKNHEAVKMLRHVCRCESSTYDYFGRPQSIFQNNVSIKRIAMYDKLIKKCKNNMLNMVQ